MNSEKIRLKMIELQGKIKYQFSDITLLANAMRSEKIDVPDEGKNHKEYTNEGLATVGDAVLKAVIADHFYKSGVKTKGEITTKKSELENNDVMHKIIIKYGLIDYAYNDKHFHSDDNIGDHEKVADSQHDPYIEALVGAIYYDSGYDKTKEWIIGWLLPLLEKYRIND